MSPRSACVLLAGVVGLACKVEGLAEPPADQDPLDPAAPTAKWQPPAMPWEDETAPAPSTADDGVEAPPEHEHHEDDTAPQTPPTDPHEGHRGQEPHQDDTSPQTPTTDPHEGHREARP